MEAMVRLADRVVVQTGKGLGEIRDTDGAVVPTETVVLTAAKELELRAALLVPNRGNVHYAADATITVDPATPPTPEEQAASGRLQAAFDYARNYLGVPDPTPLSAALQAAIDNPPTNAEVVAATRANIRMARALAVILRSDLGK